MATQLNFGFGNAVVELMNEKPFDADMFQQGQRWSANKRSQNQVVRDRLVVPDGGGRTEVGHYGRTFVRNKQIT